jgi:hypothetical protein
MSLPYIFAGEDITMSAIYWTHGYNFYTPSVQPMRVGTAISVQPMRVANNIANVTSVFLNAVQLKTKEQSYCLLRRFLLVEPRTQGDNQILAQNGLKVGQERTLPDFYKYIGLDLVKQTANHRALIGMPIDDISQLTIEEKLQRLGYLPTTPPPPRVEIPVTTRPTTVAVDNVEDFAPLI